jgi:CRISPR-associated protein Cmr2
MTHHLLAITIGPVQDFISAARRTRDLWFGSRLLSDISKAAARAIRAAGGTLIFPAPMKDEDLNEASNFSVANIILAELPPELAPATVREVAWKESVACWKRYAEEAKKEAAGLIRDEIWNDQVDDVVEFYAAWRPLDSPDQYKEARLHIVKILAGRKACRNFLPAKGRASVPKSSLDGARESVWRDPKNSREFNHRLDRRLRLSDGEQLDVVGLTKRLGGGKKGYPSVSRLAADPWLRGVARSPNDRRLFSDLKACCEGLVSAGLGSVNWTQFADFPYEGAAVYRHRHKELAQETGQDSGGYDELGNIVAELEKKFGAPEPYLAVLVADGDRMGKTISGLDSAEKHQAFSRNLAEFAGNATQIVQKYHGCLVYSGGDDVLAFLPLDQCLPCARDLHDSFGKLVGQNLISEAPSLSVGVAIGHFMEPLEDLLSYGRSAEKAAKEPDRNGLAVHLHTRGGAPIAVRMSWKLNPDERLGKWAEMHLQDQIPDKAAYDLRELALDYQGWPNVTEADKGSLKSVLQNDALQLVARKNGRRGEEGLARLRDLIEKVESAEGLFDVAREIIIAGRIARAREQAEGDQNIKYRSEAQA